MDEIKQKTFDAVAEGVGQAVERQTENRRKSGKDEDGINGYIENCLMGRVRMNPFGCSHKLVKEGKNKWSKHLDKVRARLMAKKAKTSEAQEMKLHNDFMAGRVGQNEKSMEENDAEAMKERN